MASSSSSSSALSSDPGANITLTQVEFNLFHNIDRSLFIRLVVNLGQDPSQATHVMALFMWYEKIGSDFNLISKLLKWPEPWLIDLTNEALLVLNCIGNDHFPFTNENNKYYGLVLTQKITRTGVTLSYFHENRVGINRILKGLINSVCIRAFTDIVQQWQHEKAVKEYTLLNPGSFYGPMSDYPTMGYNNDKILVPEAAVLPQNLVVPQGNEGSLNWGGSSTGGGGSGSGLDHFDLTYQKELLNNELCEILSSLELDGGGGGGSSSAVDLRREVPADDRTIFLTFSKGYPISESEIRDFFSRRYGDIIEAVYMQDVQTLEQPLYARLVFRSPAMNLIELIIDGTHKSKFAINGKHVWARKYVRKSTKSPLIISPSTSQPASPAAAAAASGSFLNFMD